ncbi:MAG: hypothetical protein NTW85_09870 [Methylococcales bacterium]|nr:hypothetical protein [Methylococcales bacterium]
MPTYTPELKDININSSAAELRNYTLAFVSVSSTPLVHTVSFLIRKHLDTIQS